MNAVVVVTTTFGSRDQALSCAREAVQAGVAACAQIDGDITSIYQWKDRLHEETECRVVLKSHPDRRPALLDWLLAQHPYDTPQILWREEFSAHPEYTKWLQEC